MRLTISGPNDQTWLVDYRWIGFDQGCYCVPDWMLEYIYDSIQDGCDSGCIDDPNVDSQLEWKLVTKNPVIATDTRGQIHVFADMTEYMTCVDAIGGCWSVISQKRPKKTSTDANYLTKRIDQLTHAYYTLNDRLDKLSRKMEENNAVLTDILCPHEYCKNYESRICYGCSRFAAEEDRFLAR